VTLAPVLSALGSVTDFRLIVALAARTSDLRKHARLLQCSVRLGSRQLCKCDLPATLHSSRAHSCLETIGSSPATDARLMMDTTLRATSEKLWPAAWSTFGGPRSSSAQNAAKNRSTAARPSGVRRSPRTASRPSAVIASVWVFLIEGDAQRRQAPVTHQHEKSALGQIGGMRRGRSRTGRSRWRRAGRP
jgi:hypothetical protein